jgi:hypothetical protein
MTPADIRACTCGNDGYGDGMFGGNGAWWIIILLLFGWGRNGFGGFGGGFGGGQGGCGCNPCATQADLAAGFNNSAVLSSLNDLKLGQAGVQQTLCQGFNGVNTTVLQGFNGVDNAICTLGYNIQGGFNTLSHQISDCCCTTQRAIDGVNFNMAKGLCDLGNVISNNTRDVIENQNANSRAILDFLTNDKIATLTAENQSLKFAASQAAQNAFITANQEAQTAELIRRLGADCPTPAYVVQPPRPVTFPTNCCGTVNYASNGGCGCGGSF